MKIRILAAVILLPLLLLVLLALPSWGTGILLSLMCAVGAYELLYGTGLVKHPRILAYSMLTAFLVGVWCTFGRSHVWGVTGAFVFCCLLFSEMLLSKAKLRFEKILVAVAAGLLIPYLLQKDRSVLPHLSFVI